MKILTELLPEITVSRFRRMKDVVDLDPPYQRESDVWKPGARSTLIDSIINGLDVPKLYFEAATVRRVGPDGLAYQYAVIDGKQRLEAIIAFLADELSLADDFLYFEDEAVRAAGMKLSALRDQYPLLARRFLEYELPIVRVTSDSGDLIEEMFQRLNASTALNAAERRNALTGPTRDAANALADHQLLVSRSPIRSARYKYRELGAKFLAIEHQLATKGKISDTKADTLYDLFVATRGNPPRIAAADMEAYRARAEPTLDRMLTVFDSNDRLLASIGTVVVYYVAFRDQAFADPLTAANSQSSRPSGVKHRRWSKTTLPTVGRERAAPRIQRLRPVDERRTGARPSRGHSRDLRGRLHPGRPARRLGWDRRRRTSRPRRD